MPTRTGRQGRLIGLTAILAGLAACAVPTGAGSGETDATTQSVVRKPTAVRKALPASTLPAPGAPQANASGAVAPQATNLTMIHGFVLSDTGAPVANALVSAASASVTAGAPAPQEDLAPIAGKNPTVLHDFADGKGPVLAEKRPRRLPAGTAEADRFFFLRAGEFMLEGLPIGALKLTASFLGQSNERMVMAEAGQNETTVNLPVPAGDAVPAAPLVVGGASPAATPSTTPSAATASAEPSVVPSAAPSSAATASPVAGVRSLAFTALTPKVTLSLKLKDDRHCGDPLNEVLYAPTEGNVAATVQAAGGEVRLAAIDVYYLMGGTAPGLVPPMEPQVKVTLNPVRVIAAGASATVPFSVKTDLVKNFYQDPAFDGTSSLIARCIFKDDTGAVIKGPDGRRFEGDISVEQGL